MGQRRKARTLRRRCARSVPKIAMPTEFQAPPEPENNIYPLYFASFYLNDGVALANVGQKLVPEPLSLAGALDQPRNVHKLHGGRDGPLCEKKK